MKMEGGAEANRVFFNSRGRQTDDDVTGEGKIEDGLK